MIRHLNHKTGAALITAIIAMVILGSIMAGIASLGKFEILSGQSISFTDDVFYLAESGVELGMVYLRRYDSDSWYNNAGNDGTLLPSYINVSFGSDRWVDLSVHYPGSLLKEDLMNPVAASYLAVYSVEPFKDLGVMSGSESVFVLVQGDLVKISSWDSNLERLIIDPSEKPDTVHYSGDPVLITSRLVTDIDDSSSTLNIVNVRGFLPSGTVKLYNQVDGRFEYIRYLNKDTVSHTFLGCVRGSNDTDTLNPSATEVAAGEWWICAIQDEATLYSTGKYNGIEKTLEVTVQLKRF